MAAAGLLRERNLDLRVRVSERVSGWVCHCGCVCAFARAIEGVRWLGDFVDVSVFYSVRISRVRACVYTSYASSRVRTSVRASMRASIMDTYHDREVVPLCGRCTHFC